MKKFIDENFIHEIVHIQTSHKNFQGKIFIFMHENMISMLEISCHDLLYAWNVLYDALSFKCDFHEFLQS